MSVINKKGFGAWWGGYFTVEAALVLPVVMCVILFLIYLAFFQYNRCLMEQDAASLLVKSGSLCVEGEDVLEQYLEQYAQNSYTDKYIAWKMENASIRVNDRDIQVKQSGSLRFPFANLQGGKLNEQWHATVTYEHKRLEPTDFIRIYQVLK